MFRMVRALGTGLTLAVMGLGCSSDAETDIANVSDELYGGGSLATLWTTSPNIPVCFRTAGNDARKTLTREILEDTWSRVTPLRFTGFGTCSSTTATNLPNTIAVSFVANSRGSSTVGRSNSRWTPVELTSNDTLQRFRYQVMHEIGHALGFKHDQVRPDNWSGSDPVYCDQFNPDEVGGVPGGITYTGGDNVSIMSYCAGFATALSARDVIGARIAYGSSTTFSCQDLSDIYGIHAGVTFGFAPTSVQSNWTSRGCNTTPSSSNACQKASDLYGIDAGVTFGLAPSSVQTWWTANSCNTKPRSSGAACQLASDTFGITAFETFGTAPSDVQSWWTATGCNTVPRNQDACQRLSDTYGIQVGSNGWAPTDVVNWWTGHSCRTSPVTSNRCQLISDNYGVHAGVTFAAAPNEARTWWTNNGCNTTPKSSDSCQRASDQFAINAGVSFGFAPAEVQTFWTSSGCNTKPTFANTCQQVSDRFGIVANVTFGAAPAPVRDWWVAQGCNTRPRDALPIPG